MTTESAPSTGDALQFDHAVPAGADAAGDPADSGVACASCRTRMTSEYFDVNGSPACEACRDAALRQAAPVTEGKLLLRAAGLGLGAAVAGAVVYYAIAAATGYELALVTIFIGWLVGKATARGTRGRGGRRVQLLAVALTYFSVAMAYLPFAMKGAGESSPGAAAVSDTVRVTAPSTAAPSTAAPSTAEPAAAAPTTASNPTGDTVVTLSGRDAALGLGALVLFTLALPVIVVFGSLPGGILSAIIIGVGMHQAWRMTAAPEVKVRGPLRVGGRRAVAPDRPDAA